MEEYIKKLLEMTAALGKVVTDMSNIAKKADEWTRLNDIHEVITDLKLEIDNFAQAHKDNKNRDHAQHQK